MSEEEPEKTVTEYLREILQKTAHRRAPYFQGIDRDSTESSVLESWIFARKDLLPRFVDVRHCNHGEDPPDFVLFDSEGGKHGLELTELVDQKLLERQLRGKPAWEVWSPQKLRQEVVSALRKKDGKLIRKWGRAPTGFASLTLLLHTDEALVNENVVEAFPETSLCSAIFTEVHLLTSPPPSNRAIPLSANPAEDSPSGCPLWIWPAYPTYS